MKRLLLSSLLLGLSAVSGWTQGINPITPPTNWLLQVIDPAFANPSNLYTTPALLGGDLTNLTVTAGTLGNGASAFTLTATQPTTPLAAQSGVALTVTSAGSATQPNRAFIISYAAGYTGSSNTQALNVTNAVAGTAGVIIPAANSNGFSGNTGIFGNASALTTGFNIGSAGLAGSGNTSVGVLGLAQVNKNSGTNIGVVGSAANAGSSPVFVGGWFSLNQTTVPTTSAALIADNAAQAVSVALFQAAGATVASVNVTGGITATLTNAATTSAVCYAVGTNGLLTYNSTIGTCTVSALRFKDLLPQEALNLAGLDDLPTARPWTYKHDSGFYDGRVRVGLIADDVEQMDRRCAVYNEDNQLQDYDERCVLLYLVADRKILKARIIALEERAH